MKLKTLLIINTITSTLFGLGMALAPEATVAPYGLTLDPGGIMITRLLGAAFIGLAALTVLGIRAKEREARQVVVLTQLVGTTVGFVAAVANQLSGAANALGWSNVLIYLLLAAGYWYFGFLRSDLI